MSLAQSLVASLAASQPNVDDKTLVIDHYTRSIIIPSGIKSLGVENDDDVLRLNFRMPRYLGTVDLHKFNIYINYINAQGKDDVYDVDDATIVGDDVVFSWLVGPTATAYIGTTSFNVRMVVVDSDSVIKQEYNTAIAKLQVLQGLKCNKRAVSKYSDLLAQWERKLFGISGTEEAKLVAASETQQQRIAEKGNEVLATIPQEYTATYNLANEGVRTKADAIICSAQGELVAVSDSSDDYLRGLKIFGKTTQAQTPSPDNPSELVSIANPIVSVYGSNLLTDYTGYKKTVSGITCEFEGEGVYHIYGTFSGTDPSIQFADIRLDMPVDPDAKYTLSCELLEGTPPDDYHPYIGLSSDIVSHRNWIAVNIDTTNKAGDIVSNTLIPTDSLNNPTHISKFWIYVYNDTLEAYTADFRIRVWLTKSDAPMPFKPYTRQRLALANTLPGIPVTSGGNYTDSDGQQWICDEIDLERGVYVRRTLNRTFTDFSEAINYDHDGAGTSCAIATGERMVASKGMCSHLPLTTNAVDNNRFNPMDGVIYFKLDGMFTFDELKTKFTEMSPTVVAILVNPIEIPLTADEIAAFKALKSHYPNTTVVNDAGAGMAVRYNADTETWIKNLIDEKIAAAIANL